MAQSLYTEDLVVKCDDKTCVGCVVRTHVDDDTTGRDHYYDHCSRHKDISVADFKRFKSTGVPPPRTVLVEWRNPSQLQLIPESRLKLLDRVLMMGDAVRKGVHDAMTGIVISVATKCALQPICDNVYKDVYSLRGLLPTTTPNHPIKVVDVPPCLTDIPASELESVECPTEDDIVVYKDWLGTVSSIESRITLKLADNSVVEIDDEQAEHVDDVDDVFQIGDIAVTRKGHLRNGRWVFGQYNANTPPLGTVVQNRAATVGISWLHSRVGSKSFQAPSVILERDQLESADFHVYNRSRRPAKAEGGVINSIPGSDSKEDAATISNGEPEMQLGMRVRFKDLGGACVKYDGSSAHGKLSRIERIETLGYDLNVFDVVGHHSDVTVQWQDLSITCEKSVDLLQDETIDDHHAAWPGEIAYTLDLQPLASEPNIKTPSRVGVIQSVNADERMARIRWSMEACIQIASDDEHPQGLKEVVLANIGVATGTCEEMTLYDLETPGEINVRRGDTVLIANKSWISLTAGAPGPEDREWLGEIVDTCLDGTLVVRLGAATVVRDVKLRREDVVVAIRSDGVDDFLDEDAEFEEDEEEMEDADELGTAQHRRPWSLFGGEGDGNMSDDASDFDMEQDARYEDEDGRIMDDEEVEDDDWESEDEDDVASVNPAPERTPPTSISVSPPHTSTANPDDNEHDDGDEPNTSTKQPIADDAMEMDTANEADRNEPLQYLMLESNVPSSHHYASTESQSSAASMKNISKQHKILQKAGAIPPGVFVRSWESRVDLMRVLLIGPSDTPYRGAPFVVDFRMGPTFPHEPPEAYFHSWQSEQYIGGAGRVNPNLYEDGKICLSLLGTWEGAKNEGWVAGKSTLLQVIVSLLGLVLVREPYFNEAGYESYVGLEAYKRPSALYSERAFLRARTFMLTALSRLKQDGANALHLEGMDEVVRWLYFAQDGLMLLEKGIRDVEEVLRKSASGDAEIDGLTVMSKGVCIPLRRVFDRLIELRSDVKTDVRRFTS